MKSTSETHLYWWQTRRGRLTVVTVTCILGLAAIFPAVDENIALRDQYAQLIQSLADARRDSLELSQLNQLATRRRDALQQLEAKAVGEAGVDEFRDRLVELTREAGCQLRRVELGPAQRRPWREQDDPLLSGTPAKRSPDSPFQLRSQNVVISVSGRAEAVRDLLQKIDGLGRLAHTRRLSLHPLADDQDDVVLELELTVFDLESPRKDIAA